MTSYFSFGGLELLRSCRVAGCKVCKPGNSHYCRCCGEKDSTHRACECPTNLKET